MSLLRKHSPDGVTRAK